MQWLIDSIVAICKAYTDSQILNGKNMPQFSIVLWQGRVVDIPDGWVICNGDNGTPNLLDRFVVCPGNDFARDETGGTMSHDHQGEDQHTHQLGAGGDLGSGKAFTTTTSQPHDVQRTGSAGTLPPYMALWYIMKL
ncbi:unnamed protein product [marine sediment metagenome]|uniref:Phage tail collar domain-containing protein n=1 Tax=marine sediment metagenome TaxID=412755 RepID=X1HPV1_9ZZZZ